MKRCPFCAEEIQDAAIKCRFCNSVLNGPQPAPGASAMRPAGGPPPGPIDSEARLLYEGAPTWRSMPGVHIFAVFLIALGVGVAIGVNVAAPQSGTQGAVGGTVFALAGGLWLIGLKILLGSRRVRITTHTIDLETGLLGKTIHTIQLWRVKDIDFEQTFLERLSGVARIHVISADTEQPKIVLRGLPGARQLFLDLRDAISIARQGKNVVGIVS